MTCRNLHFQQQQKTESQKEIKAWTSCRKRNYICFISVFYYPANRRRHVCVNKITKQTSRSIWNFTGRLDASCNYCWLLFSADITAVKVRRKHAGCNYHRAANVPHWPEVHMTVWWRSSILRAVRLSLAQDQRGFSHQTELSAASRLLKCNVSLCARRWTRQDNKRPQLQMLFLTVLAARHRGSTAKLGGEWKKRDSFHNKNNVLLCISERKKYCSFGPQNHKLNCLRQGSLNDCRFGLILNRLFWLLKSSHVVRLHGQSCLEIVFKSRNYSKLWLFSFFFSSCFLFEEIFSCGV